MSLQRWMTRPVVLTIWCVIASFGTYACMYGFRKPFTAAGFETEPFTEGSKALLVSAQVLGYMLSKFIGIKVISEMDPKRRATVLLGFIGFAELALLLFAVVPPPWSAACLFLNGLPLGMVFGLVLGFLEGRRLTEAFVAGLCASFILADGVVKSVGAWLLQSGVSEAWMPFTAGLIFLLPLIGFVWMLTQIPHPTEQDVAARAPRTPMTREDRALWLRRHGVGIGLIVLAYLLITVLRSLRADFAPELWAALGTTGEPSIYSRSEMWVALGVMLSSGLLVTVKDNGRAFLLAVAIAVFGFGLVMFSLMGLGSGSVSGFTFMVLIGLGLYLPYVVVHTTIFERLIALTRDRGNIGYLMYLADAFGYLGYVVLMFAGGLFDSQGDILAQFQQLCWWVAIPSIVAFVIAGALVWRKRPAEVQVA